MSFIYLDNAATTYPKPKEVYDYMDYMYRNFGFNSGRSHASKENNTNEIIDSTRLLLKKMVNVGDEYEVVFSPSSTIALNQIIFGIDYKDKKNIYISYFEHNSVLRTLEELKKSYDINIKFLPFDKEKWCYDFEKIEQQFSIDKPDMVIINHISNAFGYISPIEKIGNILRNYNSIFLVDASQSMGSKTIDLKKSNIDFIVFAGHKTLYGPFGAAGFIMNKKYNIKPYIFGGTGTESDNLNMPEKIPTRYEAGSMNILSIYGLNKALKWIDETGIEKIESRKKKLTKKLIDIVKKYDFIKAYLPPEEEHSSIISFKIEGYPVDSIAKVLSDEFGIVLRSGLHCAPYAHKLMGTMPEGTIRVSIGYFTTEEDLKAFDNALEEIEYEL